jgi:peptidoglycan/LPS O-acetylase OafA/YrhL
MSDIVRVDGRSALDSAAPPQVATDDGTSASTDAPQRQSGRLDSLDGIRALSIGAVFLLHADGRYFPGGFLGVDVFFILSSYLITSILLREGQKRGSVDYVAFYWRRFFRLAPALVLWLAVIALPTAILAHQVSKIPLSTTGALLYFNDFLAAFTDKLGTAYDQSWSLSVEEQFYLIWPFLFALAVGRLTSIGLRRAMGGFIAVSLVIWLTVGNYSLPTGHLVPLALGCWAACWSVQARANSRLTPLFRDNRLALACLALFVPAVLVNPLGAKGDALDLVVYLAATALLLHCTLDANSFASRMLASPVPRWIGVRSYGIYLYGLTILLLVPLVTQLSLHEALPLDVAVVAVVVALSYRFVESPFRSWGHRWLARKGDVDSSDAELDLVGMAAQEAGGIQP